MAVQAVIRIHAGGLKVDTARTSDGETIVIHTGTSGQALPESIDRSGRKTKSES